MISKFITILCFRKNIRLVSNLNIMNRRRFLTATTSSAIFASTIPDISTKSSANVSFDINSKFAPGQVTSNNIIITLSNIQITTTNISEPDKNMIIKIEASSDADNTGFNLIKKYELSLDAVDNMISIPSLTIDLGSGPDLNYAGAESAQLRLVIDHPSIKPKSQNAYFITEPDINYLTEFNTVNLHAKVSGSNSITDIDKKTIATDFAIGDRKNLKITYDYSESIENGWDGRSNSGEILFVDNSGNVLEKVQIWTAQYDSSDTTQGGDNKYSSGSETDKIYNIETNDTVNIIGRVSLGTGGSVDQTLEGEFNIYDMSFEW